MGNLPQDEVARAKRAGWLGLRGGRLGEDERAKIKHSLEEERAGATLGVAPTDDDLEALLAELLQENNPLAHLNTLVEEQAARLTAAARQSSRLDVILSDALVQSALRMGFENPAWHKGVEWPTSLWDAPEKAGIADTAHDAATAPQAAPKLLGEALAQARGEYLLMPVMASVFEDPTRVAGTLESLAPPHEPYRRLTRALQKYTEYVEAWRMARAARCCERSEAGRQKPVSLDPEKASEY